MKPDLVHDCIGPDGTPVASIRLFGDIDQDSLRENGRYEYELSSPEFSLLEVSGIFRHSRIAQDCERGWIEPATDVYVLHGWVPSDSHLRWYQQSGLYNFRTEDRRGRTSDGFPEINSVELFAFLLQAAFLTGDSDSLVPLPSFRGDSGGREPWSGVLLSSKRPDLRVLNGPAPVARCKVKNCRGRRGVVPWVSSSRHLSLVNRQSGLSSQGHEPHDG